MSTQRDRQLPSQDLDERAVADYLRTHPEFFAHQPSLAAQLTIPHECGAAVSLIEHQVQVLRDQNRQMKRKLRDLVQAGRDNDELNEKMLALTLELIRAADADELIATLERGLREGFDADAIAMRLFETVPEVAEHWPQWAIASTDPGLELFRGFFKNRRPLCGRLKRGQLEFLFGDQASDLGSAALVALGENGGLGLLAIGSFDSQRFHPGMGTIFLSRMSALIGAALQRHLPPAPHG